MSPYVDSPSRRLHRKALAVVCFCMGNLIGCLVGFTAKCALDGQTSADREWKSGKLVCIAESHEGQVHSFTLENRTAKDYQLIERYAWQIFAKTPRGLQPARDAVLSTPLFIPKGERVVVSIKCSTHGAFTVFDSSHHFRIELCGRQP
jgi:hypothetical protein